ncbi:MAG TPA: hypothetical protein VF449_05250 [Parvibaculum sp.]
MFREWLSASAAAAGVFTGMSWSRDLIVPVEPKAVAAAREAKTADKRAFAPVLKAAD